MTEPARRSSRSGAIAVGVGIFLSKIVGLVRERAIAHYLGQGTAAGTFRAALRIPNLLQNLLGEGVLTASFIPVYARLRAEGRDDDASRVARAVGTLLVVVSAVIALIGVLGADLLVDVIAFGFAEDDRALAVGLVRILFPGTALLVMSAWCLGVLNSHRRFFLPYAAPVLWNAAMISAVIAGGRMLGSDYDHIVRWLAYGMVIGAAAQLLVQLPTVIAILRGLEPSLAVGDPDVRKTLSAFVPVFLSRGSVQLSSFIDQSIASVLGEHVVAAIANAQTLALLPISLFGMAVSAAELPEMSSALGTAAERAQILRDRLARALRNVVFFVVPSAIAFAMIGDSIVALLFQTGHFNADDTRDVWVILAGSALGLSAGTQGRLLGAALYALRDQRAPLRAALVRVAITAVTGAGIALAMVASRHFVLRGHGLTIESFSPVWAAFGLTASAGFAAWIEFLLLRRSLANHIGHVPIPGRFGLAMLAIAAVAGAAGRGMQWLLVSAFGMRSVFAALPAIAAFGAVYLGIAIIARVPEANGLLRRVPGLRRWARARAKPT